MKNLKNCQACGSVDLHPFYIVKDVPIQQNTPKATFDAAQTTQRGDIRLAWCRNCGFVGNTTFDPTLNIYTADYNNEQTFSPIFNRYVENLMALMIERYDLRHKRIVEIGCGSGTFLTRLCEIGDNIGFGFDPSYNGPASTLDGRVQFISDFFGAQYTGYEADFYIARHLIEHVYHLDVLMHGIRTAIGDNPNAVVFFETPDVRWILKNVAFWDIFYEHCSLFSPGSLARLFVRHGFAVRRSSIVFGEQYQWVEAVISENDSSYPDNLDSAHAIGDLASYFAVEAQRKITHYQQYLQIKDKNTVVWGAGAKGVTFLNTLKSTHEVLPVVVDINPGKQGRFIPGTGQLIIGPEQLSKYEPDVIFVMNPNYTDEIKSTLAELGVTPSIILVE